MTGCDIMILSIFLVNKYVGCLYFVTKFMSIHGIVLNKIMSYCCTVYLGFLNIHILGAGGD